ncbi:MAG: alpha/beta hydrolase [Candidatus Rokubacteria bacterium]|nr:alpha/beta hydrolase [Candidatus Rokubacteria bacterium]
MFVERPDAKLYWQATGTGAPDLFLCPPRQPVVHGRLWKNQIPYLSHSFRVVTMDPRGNGRSDKPLTGYDFETHYADLLAVLDAAVRPPFAFVAFSCSTMLAMRYAIDHPDRVSHLIFVPPQYRQTLPQPFEEKVARVIRDDFDGWRERLFSKCLPEPHSLRGVEDLTEWAGGSSPDIYVEALQRISEDDVFELLGKIRTPTLVLPARPARARSSSRGSSTPTARGASASSSRRTAAPCPSRCWSQSCSATRAAPSPARRRTGAGSSRRRTAARSSSTRSARCRRRRSSGCSGCCRKAKSGAWARRRRTR